MKWLLILAGISLTVLCWGSYGPVLHKGQDGLASNKLKPLMCVGAAYFLIAIIVPGLILATRGELGGDWSARGITWSLMAGSAGALGALGIILALTSGGKPIYVMPLVFGGAPVVNVFVAMYMAKDTEQPSPMFFAGLILVAVGAATVLFFQPRTKKPADPPAQTRVEQPAKTAVAKGEKQPDSGPPPDGDSGGETPQST